jgi:nucleotide-binding universal stress UspA family protein
MESMATSPGILVPLDGSPLAEQALPYAEALLAPGAELTLLEVVAEPESVYGMSGRLLVPVEDAQRMLEHQAHEYLQKVEATLCDEQPRVRLEVTRGNPTVEILRVAEQGVALIAMTTHGRWNAGFLAASPIGWRAARRCRCS